RKNVEFAAQVGLSLVARRKEYDIVYLLMQGLHLVTGLPTARAFGKAMVMKISGDGLITAMYESATGRLELGWLRKWRVPLMLLNDNMMREAERAGFPTSPLVWMPNPVELLQFRPAEQLERESWRTQQGISPEDFCVVYTGRLSHEKGLRELFGGFEGAAKDIPNAKLVLVGDGPFRHEL